MIAGMHRSGTSALAGALNAAGVNFGDDLIGAAKDNKKGFFEDRQLVEANDRLLASLMQRWDTAAPLDIETAIPATARYRADAVALLQQLIADRPLSGIKDPRVSILVPFWSEIFSALDVEPYWLLCIRSPHEVASSLYQRNRFSSEKSVALWLKYTLSLLEGLRSVLDTSKILVVDFTRSLQHPEQTLRDITVGFGLDDLDQQAFLDFYDQGLVTASEAEYGSDVNALADLAQRLYQALLSEPLTLDLIESYSAEWRSLCPLIVHLDYEYHSLEMLEENDRLWVADLERQLQEKNKYLGSLEKQVNSLAEVSNRLSADLESKQHVERELKTALRQAQLYHENWSLSRMETRQALAIARERENEARQNYLTLKAVYQSTSWKISYPVRFFKRIIQRIRGESNDG
ncbi:glycosyl transferase, group 2 family [Luminiphilus syltensis NOR5-1B]|uniref:Glycosyl transferase, group 2 family n=1 Tax=Luminiphilus syltensis NOR5-1B TaxID=565045 RepID=B8KWK6_9GAMM|nr:glycosyl transferase, group 2 family [Luminiphilus syltensis NOR5-1B]